MWTRFVATADEFIVAYSVPPLVLPVKLFEIGHAVELYLKASYISMTGDVDKAVRHGHNISDLWQACKAHDARFMPGYELRDEILHAELFNAKPLKLSKENAMDFLQHQELYLIAKLLPDLKYLGTKLKAISGQTAIAVIYPNDYWVEFFSELRRFLNYPDDKHRDVIRTHISQGKLPDASVDFLSRIVGPNPT